MLEKIKGLDILDKILGIVGLVLIVDCLVFIVGIILMIVKPELFINSDGGNVAIMAQIAIGNAFNIIFI